MRRYPILTALLVAIAVPTAGLCTPASAVAHPTAADHSQLVAFHFGGGGRRGFGGGGLLGGRRGRSHHVLRRVVHALAFAYFLHLLFSQGGLSILLWLIVIGLVVHLFRRRRRRRYAY